MEKIITKEEMRELLNQADAISIDDSPMLTDWNLSGDEENLIDTKWNEDDLEYECKFAENEIFEIKRRGSTFCIELEDTSMVIVVRVKLFKITPIGVE